MPNAEEFNVDMLTVRLLETRAKLMSSRIGTFVQLIRKRQLGTVVSREESNLFKHKFKFIF